METLLDAPRKLFTYARHAARFVYACRRLLLLGLVAGLLLGALVSVAQPRLYQSSAVVSIEPQVFSFDNLLSLEGLVNNFAKRLQSEKQISDVIEVNDWSDSPAAVADRVSVEADIESFTLTIQVLDPSAQHAAAIADALIVAFEDEIESVNLRRSRNDRIRVNVLQPPTEGLRASPNWERNLAAGTGIGLVIGLALGVLQVWRRHDRILDPIDAEQILNAPTLGAIPH